VKVCIYTIRGSLEGLGGVLVIRPNAIDVPHEPIGDRSQGSLRARLTVVGFCKGDSALGARLLGGQGSQLQLWPKLVPQLI
jgi:hypothetical protein